MGNVQIEHLENHHARLTVDVDPEVLNKNMRQAARKIAKSARIPGFRPGKAPFNVIINMFGFEYVLGEAMDKIGDEIYRSALEESGIEPYGPGSLEDVQEAGQKLVFSLPKMPEVDLGDYRSIRVEFEEEEVTDEMVERSMENIRQSQAVIENVDRPAKLGDQVMLSHVAVSMLNTDDDEDDEDTDTDDAETETDAELDTDDADDADDDADELDDDELDDEEEDGDNRVTLFHEHNYEYVMHADPENEALYPGFAQELVDAVAGDELEFYLEIPADYEVEDLAGKTLFCEAHVEQVQARTVPEWTDDLAKRVSEDEFETILELRMDVRKQLAESLKNHAEQQIAEEALDQLVEMATFQYPPEFVDDYIDEFIKQLERNIAQQGIQLADWLRITQQTEDDVREQYRALAETRGRRSLVLSELIEIEKLKIEDGDVDAEINRMSERFGGSEQAEQFLSFLNSDFNRMNVANELISGRAQDRLVAIAKGENPPIEVPSEDETDAGSADASAAADEPAETPAEAVEVIEPEAAAADESADDHTDSADE